MVEKQSNISPRARAASFAMMASLAKLRPHKPARIVGSWRQGSQPLILTSAALNLAYGCKCFYKIAYARRAILVEKTESEAFARSSNVLVGSPMATRSTLTDPNHVSVRELHVEQIEDLLKLQRAAQKINSILDLDVLINKIVTEVAQSFGCLEATIYLHDETNRELVLTGVCGCTVHTKGTRKKIGKEGMVGYVAGARKMHYAPDVPKDPYYIACEPSTLSEVAIPLHVDGRLVGVFSTSHHELAAFPPAQLKLLQSFCEQIAVAIHNARRFGQERQERERMSLEAREARTIQQALLPRTSPHVRGFAITGLSVPAGEVGGDWYDYIPCADGRVVLVLAR